MRNFLCDTRFRMLRVRLFTTTLTCCAESRCCCLAICRSFVQNGMGKGIASSMCRAEPHYSNDCP